MKRYIRNPIVVGTCKIMFPAVLILLWCAVFAVWRYVRPKRPSPPVYPGALPIIGHAHQMLENPLQCAAGNVYKRREHLLKLLVLRCPKMTSMPSLLSSFTLFDVKALVCPFTLSMVPVCFDHAGPLQFTDDSLRRAGTVRAIDDFASFRTVTGHCSYFGYPDILWILLHGHVLKLARTALWDCWITVWSTPSFAHLLYFYCVSNYERWQREKEIYQFCLENGGVIDIRFGPRSAYVITDLDDCLMIANTCLDKPYLYDFAKTLYNKGLVTANALMWKPQRKLLHPAFNQQILNTFVQEYTLEARRLVTELANEVGKDQFDVVPYLLNNVMRSVYKTMIGVKPNDNEQEMTLKNYAHATDRFFALLEERLFAVWLHLPVIFNMSYLKKKQDAIIQILKNITRTIIMKRKSERKQNFYADSVKEPTAGYKSLLDLLLDIGEKQVLTDEEIREQLDTIIGAAYDSSTRTLTFCLILIGTYPNVQARIVKELQEVFDDPDRDLTRHDLPKLVYLEAVLKETLRLYPPVPRIGKCSESAVQLKHYTFPAGTIFALSLYGMNRHPVWGADANEFNPERWLNPDTLPDNPNAFASFSIGKRNCIGKQSAMMSMKTTMAYILRKYSVTGDITKVQFKCDLILKPVSGHYIGLQLRT